MSKKVLTVVIIVMFIFSITTIVGAVNVGINKNELKDNNIQSESLTDGIIDETKEEEKDSGIGLIAAALATGLACIGSGIAVAVVASSAVGAISEKPELLGKTIIFAGLAEGIAIYGLIISIMILNEI